MNKRQFEHLVKRRVLRKLQQRGLLESGRPSLHESLGTLSAYMTDPDDLAYIKDGRLVLESVGSSGSEALRRLSTLTKNVLAGAENIGLRLSPDLRPTTIRIQETSEICAVRTFRSAEQSYSQRVNSEQYKKKLDQAAHAAGFSKTSRDGWSLPRFGPQERGTAFVIMEKSGLRWSVLDADGQQVDSGQERVDPSVFGRVKARYNQAKAQESYNTSSDQARLGRQSEYRQFTADAGLHAQEANGQYDVMARDAGFNKERDGEWSIRTPGGPSATIQ
jgi:hypothetical protein